MQKQQKQLRKELIKVLDIPTHEKDNILWRSIIDSSALESYVDYKLEQASKEITKLQKENEVLKEYIKELEKSVVVSGEPLRMPRSIKECFKCQHAQVGDGRIMFNNSTCPNCVDKSNFKPTK